MNRRNLLKLGLSTAASLTALNALASDSDETNGLFCKPRNRTAAQPKGPFYPVVDQIDKDADLIYVNGSTTAALGEVVIVQGLLTDQHCRAVPGALVEVWQACQSGRYDHPSDPNPAELDPHFQYWGQAVTDQNGFYRFRTIIPGAYPAGDGWIRPPHIHFKVSKLGYMELITQMYFAGEELNNADLILRQLREEKQKEVIVDFKNDPALAHPVGQFNIQIAKI